jgi:hypothetical protein
VCECVCMGVCMCVWGGVSERVNVCLHKVPYFTIFYQLDSTIRTHLGLARTIHIQYAGSS